MVSADGSGSLSRVATTSWLSVSILEIVLAPLLATYTKVGQDW